MTGLTDHTEKKELLYMQDVTLGKGRNQLDGFCFHLCCGEMVELFGISGAGKTALYNYFMGMEALNRGSVVFDGHRFSVPDKFTDIKNVVCVSKRSALVNALSIAENICIITNRRKVRGIIHRKPMNYRINLLLQQYIPELKAEMPVQALSMPQRHMVEILRALECEAKLIYLDDIMSGYGQLDMERMEKLLAALKEKNIAIICAKHGKKPFSRITDRVLVLSCGSNVRTFYKQDYDEIALNQWMLGKNTVAALRRTSYRTNEIVFSARHLEGTEYISDFSLEIYKGEVVGFYDMNNYANLEAARMIMGISPALAGAMRLCGKEYAPLKLSQALSLGIGYIPWYHDVSGIIESLDFGENIFLPVMKKMSYMGIFKNKKAEEFLKNEYFSQMDIPETQKNERAGRFNIYARIQIIFQKWILARPKLLICEEITEDIDMKMKNIVLKAVDTLAASGSSVIITAHDMKDLMNLCDTIYIMNSFGSGKKIDKIQVMRNM